MKPENEKYLDEFCNKINNHLKTMIPFNDEESLDVSNAATYSLSAGGKRLRPLLVHEFYKLCGGKEDITNIECCIELVHTFSLIHDDLPCMDDDDFRRGKPSCHKKYGEATALLAGDALSVLPFEVISNEALKGNISFEKAVKLVRTLSIAIGIDGMIGGQMMDIKTETSSVTQAQLDRLQSLKTGALIEASCVMGCICADANDEMIEIARAYAECVGRAFQIVDDILDVEGSFEELGKTIGSDEKQGKTTYVSLMGLNEAKSEAMRLTNEALGYVSKLNNSDFLQDFTLEMLSRRK